MIIADYEQGSPEWLAWRKAGVTASEAAIVLGLSPYKTIWQLWAEKSGRIQERESGYRTRWMQGGRRAEDPLRRSYEDQHETILLPVCAESSEYPVIRASFDGIDLKGIPVETKAPQTAKVWTDVKNYGIDSATVQFYRPQLAVQMHVADASHGVLVFGRVAFVAGPAGPVAVVEERLEFVIDRDPSFEAEMVAKMLEFHEMVRFGKGPRKDPARDVFQPEGPAAKDRWRTHASRLKGLDRRLDRLKRLEERLKREKEAVTKQLLAEMGAASDAEADGVRIARYLQKGVVDYAAVVADRLPDLKEEDLEKYRRSEGERVKVTIYEETPAATAVAAPPELPAKKAA